MVSWENPEDNGGTEITQYTVECRQPSQRGWTVVSNDWTKRLIKAPLTEGCEYFFRVSAENKIGVGPSIETKSPVLAVDPIEKPGEPIDFHISEIGKTFCFLKWKKPDYDGGSRNIGYHIEKKPKEAEEWERIHKGAIKETYFMADRCIENQIYQFRVQTKNEGGESNWVTTGEVLVKEQLVEPEVKVKLEATLVVRAGDSIAIEAAVKGKPQPDVKWTKDESTDEIKKGPRLQLETGVDFSKLLITGARRTDSGKYIITASNSAGTSSATGTVNVLDRPGPVRNLKPSDITTDRCSLHWDVPEDDGGCDIYNYIIEKCETKRGVWSVHSNAVITNKAKVTRLIEGNEYIFRVRAENKMVMPFSPTDTPGPVMNLEATDIKQTSVMLTWNPPENNGGSEVIHYIVEKREIDRKTWATVKTELQPDKIPVKVSGLTPGTEYYFRVTAVNEYGSGVPKVTPTSYLASDPVILLLSEQKKSKNYLVNFYIADIPGPPEGPVEISDIDSDACSLSWNKPLEDGGSNITNYVIEKCDVTRGDWVTALSSCAKTSCRLGKLIPGKEFVFRIRAENRFGVSDPLQSERMVAKTDTFLLVLLDVPSEPLNCRVNKTNKDCMFVAWDKPETDGGSPITGYYIERKERNSLLWVKANDTVVRTTEYPCAGLIEGLEYTFRVSAINRAGQGKPSKKTDFVTARTPVGELIDNPLLDVTKNSVSLVWTRPKNDGGSKIIGYYVEAMREMKWNKVNRKPLTERTLEVTGLTEGVEYDFRVTAVNIAGLGKPSEPSASTTAQNPISKSQTSVHMIT
uniref:Titin n=1 Tax=Cyprinodon variegatus TaxID=28743 RepID=A0A3Q2DID6_CYPVA